MTETMLKYDSGKHDLLLLPPSYWIAYPTHHSIARTALVSLARSQFLPLEDLTWSVENNLRLLHEYAPMLDVYTVMQHGAQKYTRNNWRRGCEWSRVLNAALRHLHAILIDKDHKRVSEILDHDSGLPHIAHVVCNLSFLLEFMYCHLGTNDLTHG